MPIASSSAPSAAPDFYTLRAGATLVIDAAHGLLANDSDPEGNPLRALWTLTTPFPFELHPAADGSFTLQSQPFGNVVTTAPTTEQKFTVNYLAIDDQGLRTGSTVTFKLINDAPVARPDHYRVHGERPLVVPAAFGVLANDTDADGNKLEAQGLWHGDGASFRIEDDGSLTFGTSHHPGTYTYTYLVTDGFLAFTRGQFTVEVYNELPQVHADTFWSHAQTSFTIDPVALLANDIDADLDALEIKYWDWGDLASHGSLQAQPDGTYTFKPVPGTQGDLSFQYVVSDNLGMWMRGTVTLHLGNQPPQAVDDVYPVQAGQRLTLREGGVLRNDHDIEGDRLVVTRLDTQGLHGTLTLGRDGSVDFLPEPGFVGTTTARFVVADGWGGLTPSTVSFVVQPGAVVNQAPAPADDHFDIASATPALLRVLSNDTDPDAGQTLAVTAVGRPQHGQVSLQSDGALRYTPPAVWTGIDRFDYTVADGMGGKAQAQVVVHVAGSHQGTDGDDLLNGIDRRADSLEGGDGNDYLLALGGDDFVRAGAGNDRLLGGAGADTLLGGDGQDTLEGGPDADVLVGGPGADTIFPGGADVLADNAVDLIVFDSLPGSRGEADRVVGFSARGDRIALDPAVFTALLGGPTRGMDATELVIGPGAAATQPEDHLLWDTTAGTLAYDPDGNGALPAVLLASFELVGGLPGWANFTLDLPMGL